MPSVIHSPVPTPRRGLLSISEAARLYKGLLPWGERRFAALVASGEFTVAVVHIGGRAWIKQAELDAWLDGAEAAS